MKYEYTLGIIIPVYNVEKYLEECLESVANQIVPFDEVILVNDGSLDKSGQICERYCKKYSYFQLINQENHGLGSARNTGMKKIKSDYFVFLDSDDYIVLWMAETIKRKLNDQDILFYAASIYEDMEGVIHTNNYLRDEDFCNCIMSGLAYFYHSFPKRYIVSACMGAYKRNFLEKNDINFPEGLYYEDNLFYIKLIIHAKKIECILEQLYIRRYREGSIMTSNVGEKNCLDKMKIETKIWDYIREHSSVKWKKDILCSYFFYGMSEVIGMIECYGEEDIIEEQENIFLEKFIDYWSKLYENNLKFFHEYFILLKIYRKISKNNLKYKIDYEKIKTLLIKKIKEKLEELPLRENDKIIGIYGMGKHTKAMFSLYEKYVDEIKCQYFYVVSDFSYMKLEQNDERHPIVSYKNIPENIDLIIVSSLIYMDAMNNNLKKMKININKIHTLYQVGEQTDLVVMENYIANIV